MSGTTIFNATQKETHGCLSLGEVSFSAHPFLAERKTNFRKNSYKLVVDIPLWEVVHIHHAVIVMDSLGAGAAFLVCCMILGKSLTFLGVLSLSNKWFQEWTQMEAQRQFYRRLKEKFQGKQAVWERRLKEEEEKSGPQLAQRLATCWGAQLRGNWDKKQRQSAKQSQQINPTKTNYKPAKQQQQKGCLSSQHRKEITKEEFIIIFRSGKEHEMGWLSWIMVLSVKYAIS